MTRLLLFALALALFPCTAAAQDAPTADEAKKVIDYYYGGDGAVLASIQVCKDVPNTGDRQYECVNEVQPSDLLAGETYDLRMVYLVPREQQLDDIFVQYNRGGITRSTDEVSVSGSIRYRTWKTFSLDTAGSWTIKVLRDAPDGVQTLRELQVTVSESDS